MSTQNEAETTSTTPAPATMVDSTEILQSFIAADALATFDWSGLYQTIAAGATPTVPTWLLNAHDGARTQESTASLSLSVDDLAFVNKTLQAYLWGYGPMTVWRLEQAKTNKLAPHNTFYHAEHLPDWQAPSPVSAPNLDVLYSSAFLDLGLDPDPDTDPDTDRNRGPQVLTIPASSTYTVVQIDDIFGNSQVSLGLRTQPGAFGGRYLLVGPSDPGFTDPLAHTADGFDANHVVPIDTPHAWLIVRVPVSPYAVVGAPADLRGSLSYQLNTQFTLTPFRDCGQPPDPMDPEIAEKYEFAPDGPDSGAQFFDWLGKAVAENPLPTHAAFSTTLLPPTLMSPSASVGQTELFDSFAPIGLDATGFHADKLTQHQQSLLEIGARIGNLVLKAGHRFMLIGPASQNHWHVLATCNIGKYPNTWPGYLMRSMAGYEGGIASLAVDGTYPLTGLDAQGLVLRGRHAYRIHFEAGKLPPISPGGFWSLAIYTDTSASGSTANLPCVAAAAVNNTAYSNPATTPVILVDTTHFSMAPEATTTYANNDTIYFADSVQVTGITPATPYYVCGKDDDTGIFQLAASWPVDPEQMIASNAKAVGIRLGSGKVIPVYALGSQQLPGSESLTGQTLTINPDGSLDIYLQNSAPADRTLWGNWLPIPDTGNFEVIARLYNPLPATPQSGAPSILSASTIALTTSDPIQAAEYPQTVTHDNRYGTYTMPPVQRVRTPWKHRPQVPGELG
jgi:hypothetical protein